MTAQGEGRSDELQGVRFLLVQIPPPEARRASARRHAQPEEGPQAMVMGGRTPFAGALTDQT